MKTAKMAINLSKVDKTKIFTGKNGDKYLFLLMFISDEPNKYGKHFALAHEQTKEEREEKEKLQYVGDGAYLVKTEKSKKPQQDENNDLPF